MARFTVNPRRRDPYRNFKFRVKLDGIYVAGVSRVGALRRSTEVVEHREGGDASTSRRSPGRTVYEPIRLERGITQDTAFEEWANQVWRPGAPPGAEVAPANFRKDIVIEVYNQADRLMLAYKVHRCWVSSYQALPDLSSDENTTLVQSITLEHEGWERDMSVAESREQSATPNL